MNAEFLKWWCNQHGDPTEIGLMQVALRAFEHGVLTEREACAKECMSKHANGNFVNDTRSDCAISIRERSIK